MSKNIITGLIVAAIIGGFGLLRWDIIRTFETENRIIKAEIMHEIKALSTRIGVLGEDIETVKTDVGTITTEIKNEKKIRRSIAMGLVKAGIEIPTDALIAFSGEKSDQLSKDLFTELYNSFPLITKESEYLKFMNKMTEKGLDDKLICKVNDDFALVGFQQRNVIVNYLVAKKMPFQLIYPTLYKAGVGSPTNIDPGYGWTEPLRFFKLPGLNASDVIRIQLKK